MPTTTYFRTLDKDQQKNFKHKFPGLDGIKFNMLMTRFLDIGGSKAMVDNANSVINCMKGSIYYALLHPRRDRDKLNAIADTYVNDIIDLCCEVEKRVNKQQKVDCLHAEARGEMSLAEVKEKYKDIIYIEQYGKTKIDVHLMSYKTGCHWTDWYKMPLKAYYSDDEIKAAIAELIKKKRDWFATVTKHLDSLEEKTANISSNNDIIE